MIWVLVAIIVIAIYNAERLPHLMNKIKDEVPHLVEAGKKASKEIKEKAQAAHQEKSSGRKKKMMNKFSFFKFKKGYFLLLLLLAESLTIFTENVSFLMP